MKILNSFIAMMLLFSNTIFAQVGINADNSAPDGSAMLDVNSSTKGALLPRMTQAQILAIQNPASGLMVFCTTDKKLYIYASTSTQWKEVQYGPGILQQPFLCGSNITISHVAGAVAPVTKTTTYGTVTNIPGETTKCWITSNLGADHQATAVDDATEASAGWLWQFNRKRGYKHDGTTRTPNSTWITGFFETSDWTATNDPCNIELGTTWRIPTYTEWDNVNSAGNWATWPGPWNSGLKMHAAGYLIFNDGSLGYRGIFGSYWSNMQLNYTNSWLLSFFNSNSHLVSNDKAFGYPVRCVRDY